MSGTKQSLLYRKQDIYRLEKLAYEQLQLTPGALMLRAAEHAWSFIKHRWPQAQKIAVFCGSGNNAGDGYVLARLAHQAGYQVTVYSLTAVEDLPELPQQMVQSCQNAEVAISQFTTEADLNDCDLIVDAIFGIGLSRAVEGIYLEAIHTMNNAEVDILALDCPSGLDVDTGCLWGETIHATATITFIGLKQGLFTAQAPAHCGDIELSDLDLDDSIYDEISCHVKRIIWKDIKPLLPRRRRDAHKGSFGHVLVVGGDYGMGGAVRLAAESAARVGSGLVTVATRPEHVGIVSGSRPEIMCHQVVTAQDLSPLLDKATTIVLGPGLGQSSWSKELFQALIQSELPLIMDADSLNLLAKTPSQNSQWVLTPHPGEASRLLGCAIKDVQANRFSSIQEICQRYGGVVVLKGAGTLIRGTEGGVRLCSAGNPGMASGGMGDILSGIIGGLVAQGLSLFAAAQSGVWIHAKAADLAASADGERGLLATDLLPHLRKLVNPNRPDM